LVGEIMPEGGRIGQTPDIPRAIALLKQAALGSEYYFDEERGTGVAPECWLSYEAA